MKVNLFHFMLYCYIFFVSWTSTFRISSWFTVPFIISLFILYLGLFRIIRIGYIPKFFYKKEDLLLVIFMISISFSAMINPNSHSMNYIFAYTYIFIIYLFFKLIYSTSNIKIDNILKANAIAILFVALFVIFEFVLNYFSIIDIQALLPRTRDVTATYLGGTYRRAYGFSTEPTIVAFYFNTLGPIGLWYWFNRIKGKNITKLFITIVYLLAILLTFSPTVVFLLLSIVIVALYNIISKNRINISHVKKFFLVTFAIVITITIINSQGQISRHFEPYKTKILLQQHDQPGSRINRWQTDIERLIEAPIFGIGVGGLSTEGRGSSVNWYLFLALEGGTVSLAIILVFLAITFFRITKSKLLFKNYVLVGYLAGTMHLSVISTFYYTFLWLLLIIFNICEWKSQDINSSKRLNDIE